MTESTASLATIRVTAVFPDMSTKTLQTLTVPEGINHFNTFEVGTHTDVAFQTASNAVGYARFDRNGWHRNDPRPLRSSTTTPAIGEFRKTVMITGLESSSSGVRRQWVATQRPTC